LQKRGKEKVGVVIQVSKLALQYPAGTMAAIFRVNLFLPITKHVWDFHRIPCYCKTRLTNNSAIKCAAGSEHLFSKITCAVTSLSLLSR
jgi:hypothetical protein